jgi:Major Facilitator Superfamily
VTEHATTTSGLGSRRWPIGPFAVLSQRDFRLLCCGQLVSLLGDQLFLVALPFVLLSGRHDARRLGVVLLCLGLARAVSVAFGGGLSDRFRQRMIMLYTDLARLVLTALLAVIVLATSQPLLAIAVLATGLGLAQGLFLPSSYSIVPQLVDDEHLVAANSVISAQTNASTLVGPALGGVIVAGASAGTALLIDAVTFGVSALSLALIRMRGRTRGGGKEGGPAVEDRPADPSYRGFLSYLVRSRLLPFSAAMTFVVNLGYVGITEIALPALARERFTDPAFAFGLLLTGSALGAIGGAVFAHRILARRSAALLALAAGMIEGTTILLVPVGPGIVGSWLELLVVGFAGAVVNVFFVSALQRTVPREYLGRAMSLLLLAAFATSPASYGLVAFLVTTYGPTPAFVFGGTATIVAFGMGFFSREIRRLGLV